MQGKFLGTRIFYSADGGQGGGGATGNASGQSAAPEGAAQSGETTATTEARFSQDDINRFLAEEKRRWKAQQDEAASRARQQAEDEAKAKQGEFQQLAEQRASRISQLETEHSQGQERLTQLETAMEAQLKARLKALPDEIRAMDPGGDVLTRYEWVAKAEIAAQKLAPAQPARPTGTPPGPRGTGGAAPTGPNQSDLIAEKRARIGGL